MLDNPESWVRMHRLSDVQLLALYAVEREKYHIFSQATLLGLLSHGLVVKQNNFLMGTLWFTSFFGRKVLTAYRETGRLERAVENAPEEYRRLFGA